MDFVILNCRDTIYINTKIKMHACGVPTRGTIISGKTSTPWLDIDIAASKMARACISVNSGYDIPSLKILAVPTLVKV